MKTTILLAALAIAGADSLSAGDSEFERRLEKIEQAQKEAQAQRLQDDADRSAEAIKERTREIERLNEIRRLEANR